MLRACKQIGVSRPGPALLSLEVCFAAPLTAFPERLATSSPPQATDANFPGSSIARVPVCRELLCSGALAGTMVARELGNTLSQSLVSISYPSPPCACTARGRLPGHRLQPGRRELRVRIGPMVMAVHFLACMLSKQN